MIKKLLFFILLVVLLVSFVGCSSGRPDAAIENEQVYTNKNSKQNTSQPLGSRDRGNLQSFELDSVLQSLAEAILNDTDIAGELSAAEKQSLMRAMPGQIFTMINEFAGLSLISGISLSGQDFSIAIYESSDADKDAEFFQDPESSGRIFPDRPDFNGAPPPDGSNFPVERDVPRDENRTAGNGNWSKRGGRNMFEHTEDSEIKVIRNYIIIANTQTNDLVFKICTTILNN